MCAGPIRAAMDEAWNYTDTKQQLPNDWPQVTLSQQSTSSAGIRSGSQTELVYLNIHLTCWSGSTQS